ncbi:MAG: hypothetical protein ACLFTT_09060 [Candidatus Hydrogenedentota bacterium]
MNINTAYIPQAPGSSADGPRATAGHANADKGHNTDNTLAAYDAAALTFDLSQSARNLLGTVLGLGPDQLDDFLDISVDLLRAGVVGKETLEVNGQRRETFVAARMADPALRGAPPYRTRTATPAARLDLRG